MMQARSAPLAKVCYFRPFAVHKQGLVEWPRVAANVGTTIPNRSDCHSQHYQCDRDIPEMGSPNHTG